MSIGSEEPFTVTRSTARHSARTWGESMSANFSDMRISTSNCSVALSRRAARFTFGERYDASIFSIDPIAPSMAQPTCRPKPIVVRYPGRRSCILGCSVNFRRSSAACTSRHARTKLCRARSATVGSLPSLWLAGSPSLSSRSLPNECDCWRAGVGGGSVMRQAIRKASPMFLLGAPPVSLTARWTIAAMVFTKTITSSCRHSVQSAKLRTIENPKTAVILRPAIMGLRSPSAPRLFPMISDPASPNAIWSICPNFWRALSTKSVSNSPPSACSSFSRGLCERFWTSRAILARGRMTRRLASLWKRKDEIPNSTTMHVTCAILRRASARAPVRFSRTSLLACGASLQSTPLGEPAQTSLSTNSTGVVLRSAKEELEQKTSSPSTRRNRSVCLEQSPEKE
mmetsp:Transcript_8794/g.19446  ORF Transcript_8794/g.19446 Transcript_8794/m.19446 type:complete len:399 (+) Transcript_8794:363-1559(+)